jgi:type VI secretion system protein ImpF
MVSLNARDRLQPSLLDRLIDADPRQSVEGADSRALTRQQLRAAVLRDLSWLFNATRDEPDPASDRRDEIALWAAHDEARRSVLNYGMPAFAGTTLASLDTGAIERGIENAIRQFEPRIDPATVHVEVRTGGQKELTHNVMSIVIRGQMWSQPVPLELLLAADMDMETGHTQVREMNR